MTLFAQAADEGGGAVIAAAFAIVVQQRGSKSALLLEIASAADLFRAERTTTDPALARALAMVLPFVEAVSSVQKKKIAAAVKAVHVEALFPEIQGFAGRPLVVGKEMENTWAEWSAELSAKAFSCELAQLESVNTKSPL
jgi:hypothetical protein